MLMTVQPLFLASSYTAWLKPKPWHCEINARDHRERAGTTHNHPGQNLRVHRSGNNVAIRPNKSAPSAAVAVQPYQYIAGARNPSEGSTTSRAWCVPGRTTPIEG